MRDVYSTILRKLPIVVGAGVVGVTVRYFAYHLQTGHVSLGAYAQSLCQWDCGWFHGLASDGYQLEANANGEANWAFFPLLPILMASMQAVTGLPLVVCGALLSQVCIGLAAAFAALLFEDDAESYWLFCALILAGPFSFYYGTGLTEALFIMLTVLVLACLHEQAYLAAGVAAAFLSATRPTGIFAGLMILWQMIQDYRRGQLPVGRALLACVLAPVGLISFMIYLHFHVGDALAFAHVQAAWNKSLINPVTRAWDGLIEGPSSLDFWLSLSVIAALILGVIAAIRGAVGEALFCLASTVLALSSGLQSLPRYAAGLAPLTMVLARLMARPAYVRIAAAVLGVALGFVATMKWIGGFQFLV